MGLDECLKMIQMDSGKKRFGMDFADFEKATDLGCDYYSRETISHTLLHGIDT